MKKKVLIITYYWPPSGGGGVQRWLKFAKYLPQLGWEPLVVSPENPDYPTLDASLLQDIAPEVTELKVPIWEPYQLFKVVSGKKKHEKVNTGILETGKKQSATMRLALWLRGNLLIPDPRVFWVRPAVKRLSKLIPELKPDVLITTGPPHSVHLIGMKLSRKFGLPWLADFRDPWSTIDYLDWFKPSAVARKLQRKLEHEVLTRATAVLTVSENWADELRQLGARKVHVITNGFDEDDFVAQPALAESTDFVLTHAGIITSFRNPSLLWNVLDQLLAADEQFASRFRLRLIGTVDEQVKAEIASLKNLQTKTEWVGYLPHEEVLKEYRKASLLLLLTNQSGNAAGHIPGKLFEYLASEKPVLALGDTLGDVARILKETGAGVVASASDTEAMRSFFTTDHSNLIHTSDETQKYSRLQLTRLLDDKLNQLLLKYTGMKKKKILFVYTKLNTFVERDIQILSAVHSVKAFSYPLSKKLFLFVMAYVRQLWFLLRNIRRADALYVWFADYHSFLPALFGKYFGKPCYIVAGGYDATSIPELGYGLFYRKNFRSWLGKKSFEMCSKILPVDESLIENANAYVSEIPLQAGIKAYCEVQDSKFKVIPTGYNLEIWKPVATERKKSVLSVASVASFNRWKLKGGDILMEIARRMPDVPFHFYGLTEGFQLELKNRETVPSNFHLHGFVKNEELPAIYSAHHIYAQLSLSEGLPNVLCEAMLCGCIPVGSAVNGIPNAIGNTGFILTKRDASEAVKLITMAMDITDHAAPAARVALLFEQKLRETELMRLFE